MRWRWFWFVAACGLGSLLYHLSARWVDAGLARQSHGALRLAEAEGTVWRGRAKLIRLDASGGAVAADGVSWVFQPARLRQGQWVWRVSRGERAFELEYGDGGWRTTEASAAGALPQGRF